MTKAQPFDIEKYLHLVQSFHGYVAPGVIIGGFMVNLAKIQDPGRGTFRCHM